MSSDNMRYIGDRGARLKLDTGYSSSTHYHQRLEQLRRRHGYVSPETIQETVADNKQKVTDSSRQPDVSDIRKRAEPVLSDEAKLELDKIKNFLEGNENKLLEDEYKNSVKKVLGILSPETLADYKKHKIEFVVDSKVSYPTAKRNEKGEWKLKLPTKYEYPFQGMILRCFDEVLKVEFDDAKKKAQGSGNQANMVHDDFLRSRRIMIAARVFLTNMRLGKNYGWDIKGYEMVQRYKKYYNKCILYLCKNEYIYKNTKKEFLIRNCHKYAAAALLNSIMCNEQKFRIFPSMQPAAYFEEFNIERREIKHKDPPTTFLATKPIKLATQRFKKLMELIDNRRKEGRGTTLNVVILPNKEIWVLPYYYSKKGERSLHSIIAKGNPCAWAGEVIIQDNKVISIKDQSGHYKTYAYCDKAQKIISDFALQAFRDQGYEVPSEVDLTVKGYLKGHGKDFV